MNKVLSHIIILLTTFVTMACQSDEASAMPPANSSSTDGSNKTLIVYYSYMNHTEEIVNDLRTLINADVIEVEPVDKTLKYEANNYAIGTEQLNKIQSNPNSESSYPEIELSFPDGIPEGWDANNHSPSTGELEGVSKYNTKSSLRLFGGAGAAEGAARSSIAHTSVRQVTRHRSARGKTHGVEAARRMVWRQQDAWCIGEGP